MQSQQLIMNNSAVSMQYVSITKPLQASLTLRVDDGSCDCAAIVLYCTRTQIIAAVRRRIVAAVIASTSPVRCLRVRPSRSRAVRRDADNSDGRAPRIARVGGAVKGRRRIHRGMFAKGNSCRRSETTSGLCDCAEEKRWARL